MASLSLFYAHFGLLTLFVLLLAPCPGSSTLDYQGAPPNSLLVTRTPLNDLPGLFQAEYHVVIGYGTPAQSLSVGFDTRASWTHVSPVHAVWRSVWHPSLWPIPVLLRRSSPVWVARLPAEDLLRTQLHCHHRGQERRHAMKYLLQPVEHNSITVMTDMISSSSILDLSRDIHSLTSRAPSFPDTVAFSYCLPSLKDTQGFLSIGAPRS
jgi:hypothetical protein